MSRVLITAGPVYGLLDDNKLVGNRVRGIWACRFAGYLSAKGHNVTLLVADTMPKFTDMNEMVGTDWTNRGLLCKEGYNGKLPRAIEVVRFRGFDEYRAKCHEFARTHDAAVMAAAVVNWIPAEPIKGKMDTHGYEVGDRINIPFYLAPRVIQEMKPLNPGLTLIGCKMLIGASQEELIGTAYEAVLLKARCNVVVANDMRLDLKNKHLVYQDHSHQHFHDDWPGFYEALEAVITDRHYRTTNVVEAGDLVTAFPDEAKEFDDIVERHRDRFVKPIAGRDMVFGSLAVWTPEGWLCSPREKGVSFSSKDLVLVRAVKEGPAGQKYVETEGGKATLNAPLLIRYGTYSRAQAVLHLHEQIPGLPTLPYAPPGTYRDNDRSLPIEATEGGFNIEGHGCVLPLYGDRRCR